MIELRLIGYTADLGHLVVSAGDPAVRYKVPVDADLLATVGEVLDLESVERREALLRVLGPRVPATARTAAGVVQRGSEPLAARGVAAAARPPGAAAGDDGSAAEGAAPAPPSVAVGAPAGTAAPDVALPAADEPPPRGSRLTPAEIQRLLRAGASPESVAARADADLGWVLRWYRPIAAEQEQVVRGVQRSRQAKARLGDSRDLVGDAVRSNLLALGVDPEDPAQVRWVAARRDGQPVWTVQLRFRAGGKAQTARWRYDPDNGEAAPTNDLAFDLGWTRPVRAADGRRRAAGAGTPAEDAPDVPPPGPVALSERARRAAAATRATGAGPRVPRR